MDPVSQAALGGAVAGSAASPARLVVALALGAVAGMAADLDVFIRSAEDPLLFLDYHRQFTHALVFIPAGGLLCALVAWPLARRWLGFRQVLAFCLLGYASHGVLDACTSYGTQLLWPFSPARIAWNRVSVVDPLFTVPLLALLLTAALTRRTGFARGALCWALLYLALGQLQGWRVESAGRTLAAARGHSPVRLVVKPAFGNLLLWKLVYEHEGVYRVDALRAGKRVTVHPGEQGARLQSQVAFPWLAASPVQAADVERFRRFSADWLARDPAHRNRVVDVRYSMLPNRIDALWGIELKPEQPQQHADFVTDRAASPAMRAALLQMLLKPGLPLDAAASQP